MTDEICPDCGEVHQDDGFVTEEWFQNNPFHNASLTELVDNLVRLSDRIISSSNVYSQARDLAVWQTIMVGLQTITPGYLAREFMANLKPTNTPPEEPPLPGEEDTQKKKKGRKDVH